MKKLISPIPFNYITIKTTKSRIEKGLLAIPVSLIDLFPKVSTKIFFIDEHGKEEIKTFTPYNSSSRECRIGGLKSFYERYKIQSGDELVIQVIDDGKFRIMPEKIFEKQIFSLEKKIEKAKNELETDQHIHLLSEITNESTEETIKSEFIRLANQELTSRKTKIVTNAKTKESVPASLRKFLLELYKGKCQVSNFTFLMKNGKPYFELHHINAYKGNHFKNLLVVSPNIHAQFTHSNLELFFDNDGWLRKVKFNEETRSVFQIIDRLPKTFEKEIHF